MAVKYKKCWHEHNTITTREAGGWITNSHFTFAPAEPSPSLLRVVAELSSLLLRVVAELSSLLVRFVAELSSLLVLVLAVPRFFPTWAAETKNV